MLNIFKTICSILVFTLCVYLLYFKTDFGYSNKYMIVSGIPYWLSSIIACIFVPIITYFGLDEHVNK